MTKRNSCTFSTLNYSTIRIIFYQQLLLKLPAQSEADLKNSYPTYKDYFEAKYPAEYSLALDHVQHSMQSNIQKYTKSYQNLVNNLVTSLHTDL